MTIKEATSKMLRDISYAKSEHMTKRITDKEIAKEIGITQACYSRLITQVTTPNIMTWYKINQLHKQYSGITRNMEIVGSLTI